MNRRTFIGSVAAGSITGTISGCLGSSNKTSQTSETAEEGTQTKTRTETPTQTSSETENPPAPYMFEMGERVQISKSTTLRLGSPISTKKLEFEDGETRSAPEGKQFVLVKTVAERYKDRTPWFPTGGAFAVKERSEMYWSEIGSIRLNTLTHPVSDEFYHGSIKGIRGERSAGQLVFIVPEAITADVAVVLAFQRGSLGGFVGWEGSTEPL